MRRDSKEIMESWKRRIAPLLEKEQRCPACQKLRKENEGTTKESICSPHKRIRINATFSKEEYNR